jgi:DNA invertase Pin-like site-specific DNA recombinase
MERRPQLDQCLVDARARQFDVLLTYDSSRLARDGRLWTNLVHNLGLAGVRVEYLTLPPDETPVCEFMRWIMAGVGQLERATIRERTHAGRLAKARSERFVTGRWPCGYRSSRPGPPGDQAGPRQRWRQLDRLVAVGRAVEVLEQLG